MLTKAAVAALSQARDDPFSFFPPVKGLDDNRWLFNEARRIEFSATHMTTGQVAWFPRSNVSYVTIEEDGITVALQRELVYSEGAVWPVRGESASAAVAADAGVPAEEAESEHPLPEEGSPAATPPAGPFAGLRRASREPYMLVLASAGGAALVLIMVLVVARAWLNPERQADVIHMSDSAVFTLVAEDNQHDVIRKIGQPERERVLSPGSGVEHQVLLYDSRNYAVVLMGVQGARGYEQEPRYIGAIRLSDGAVLASVSISHDTRTDGLLKALSRQIVR